MSDVSSITTLDF